MKLTKQQEDLIIKAVIVLALIFLVAFMYNFFSKGIDGRAEEKATNTTTTTEVVFRVATSASGSGGAMRAYNEILTESGRILSARSSEKAFFAREGDTITVQTLSASDGEILREKIIDIKFKK